MNFETNKDVLDWYEKQTLPGFDGLTKVGDKISEIVSQKTLAA